MANMRSRRPLKFAPVSILAGDSVYVGKGMSVWVVQSFTWHVGRRSRTRMARLIRIERGGKIQRQTVPVSKLELA